MSLNLGLNLLSFSTDQQQSVYGSFRTLANNVASNNSSFFNKSANMDTLTLSPAALLKQKLAALTEQHSKDLKEQEANIQKAGQVDMSQFVPVVNEFTPTDADTQLIEKITELGKKFEKTLDVDDVTWGALVYLGESMGITDTKMLAELQVGDIFQCSNEFMIKNQSSLSGFVSEESLNRYGSMADFWNAKFTTGESGNISRNEYFKMTFLDAARPNITTGMENPNDADAIGQQKLHTLGASSIIMMAQGFNEDNYAKIMWANAQSDSVNPKVTTGMTQTEQTNHYASQWSVKNYFYTINHQSKGLDGEWYYEKLFTEISQRGASIREATGSSFTSYIE